MANRSRKKPPFVDYKLVKAVKRVKSGKVKGNNIQTYSRSSTIYPDFVDLTIQVYNGKTFIPVVIDERKVGRKLGEFSPTRKYTKRTLTKNTLVAKKDKK